MQLQAARGIALTHFVWHLPTLIVAPIPHLPPVMTLPGVFGIVLKTSAPTPTSPTVDRALQALAKVMELVNGIQQPPLVRFSPTITATPTILKPPALPPMAAAGTALLWNVSMKASSVSPFYQIQPVIVTSYASGTVPQAVALVILMEWLSATYPTVIAQHVTVAPIAAGTQAPLYANMPDHLTATVLWIPLVARQYQAIHTICASGQEATAKWMTPKNAPTTIAAILTPAITCPYVIGTVQAVTM